MGEGSSRRSRCRQHRYVCFRVPGFSILLFEQHPILTRSTSSPSIDGCIIRHFSIESGLDSDINYSGTRGASDPVAAIVTHFRGKHKRFGILSIWRK